MTARTAVSWRTLMTHSSTQPRVMMFFNPAFCNHAPCWLAGVLLLDNILPALIPVLGLVKTDCWPEAHPLSLLFLVWHHSCFLCSFYCCYGNKSIKTCKPRPPTCPISAYQPFTAAIQLKSDVISVPEQVKTHSQTLVHDGIEQLFQCFRPIGGVSWKLVSLVGR